MDNALCSHRIHLRQSHRLGQLFYSPALTEDSATCSLNTLGYFFYSINAADPRSPEVPSTSSAPSRNVQAALPSPHENPDGYLFIYCNRLCPLAFYSLVLKMSSWVSASISLFSSFPFSPSVHYRPPIILCRVEWLQPFPADVGREADYTLVLTGHQFITGHRQLPIYCHQPI